jgi:hypothetical protein
MGGGYALLLMPILLALPFACVAVILRLCEWSWGKPAGSMGSTKLLAGFGAVCLANILLICLAAWLLSGGRF